MQTNEEDKQESTLDDFVTAITVTYPVELAILKGRLEAEGIEYRVLNELTTQVYPFISNAIGGVKLQVRQSDFENTIEILKDSGHLNEVYSQPSKIFSKINLITSQIPLFKNLRLELRLMIALALPVLAIISIVFFASLPSTLERLTEQRWCLDMVTYQGENYSVNTEGLRIIIEGQCDESIDIRTNGMIWLPGFNSRAVLGEWNLNNSNTLQIMYADTFDFVYNGIYEIDFSDGELILESDQTTLHCHLQ